MKPTMIYSKDLGLHIPSPRIQVHPDSFLQVALLMLSAHMPYGCAFFFFFNLLRIIFTLTLFHLDIFEYRKVTVYNSPYCSLQSVSVSLWSESSKPYSKTRYKFIT